MNFELTLAVLVIGFTAIMLAVIQFIKTPRDIKFQWQSNRKDPDAEYAPEFTTKEKVTQLLRPLIWFVPVFLLANEILLPELSHGSFFICSSFIGVSGFSWFFILLLWLPLLVFVVLLIQQCLAMLKVLCCEQYPLPGQKVFKPTKVLRGAAAKKQAWMMLVVSGLFVIALLVLSLLLPSVINDYSSELKVIDYCNRVQVE